MTTTLADQLSARVKAHPHSLIPLKDLLTGFHPFVGDKNPRRAYLTAATIEELDAVREVFGPLTFTGGWPSRSGVTLAIRAALPAPTHKQAYDLAVARRAKAVTA